MLTAWSMLSLTVLVFVLMFKVDCKVAVNLSTEPGDNTLEVTISETVAVTKTVDGEKLSDLKKVLSPVLQKLGGDLHVFPPAHVNPPGKQPEQDMSGGLVDPDGNPVPMPPNPDGMGPNNPGPEPPTGVDGSGPGGRLGDRCPVTMKDENGKFPDVCYDVIDENGACLMDDMILSRDQCIQYFGQDFYDKLLQTQADIEASRAKAMDEMETTGTASPDIVAVDPDKEAEKEEAIEAEGRSLKSDDLDGGVETVRRKAPSLDLKQREVANRDGPFVNAESFKRTKKDGPSFNVGVMDGYLETRPVGPTLGYFESLGRKKKDGPTFNLDVLDSLGDMQTAQAGPTLGYFQSLGRQKKDGPTFNTGVLDNLEYLQSRPMGPTLGYFESLGRSKRSTDDFPQINVDTLNSLGQGDKEDPNSAWYSPDSQQWSNAKILPESGPSSDDNPQ